MADKPTKPRRDLRARLGKTITPKTEGAPAAGAATPPAVASAAATPAPKIKSGGGGIAAPPPTIGTAPIPGSELAPPPFARPVVAEPPRPADPFAAVVPVQQQVVRLEFDERPVADSEVGRKRFWIYGV